MFVSTLPSETEIQQLRNIKVFYCPKRDQLITGFITTDFFNKPLMYATYCEYGSGKHIIFCEPAKEFILIGDLYE